MSESIDKQTISNRINSFCEDYSEIDALDLIRIRYELKKDPLRFSQGLCHLEKAIEEFLKAENTNDCRCMENSVKYEKNHETAQSELSTPNRYSTEN